MAKLTDRTELTTPADGDLYVTTDVSDTTDAATGTDKKITWANIKAALKTYFDTLYAAALGADDNYVTDAEKAALHASGSDNQTIVNSSDDTSHTVTLSASGGSVQLVEGTNITLTTTGTGSAGVVTISSIVSGTGITWSEVTGTTQTASVNYAYIANNAALVTITIPTTAPIGSILRVVGKGAGGWKIAQNASEQIIWNQGGVDGVNETTVGTGGYLASTDDYDAIELVCIVADTTWTVLSAKGNITLA